MLQKSQCKTLNITQQEFEILPLRKENVFMLWY